MVMKSAEDRNRCDAAYVLDRAMDRSVFAKRPMGPLLVIQHSSRTPTGPRSGKLSTYGILGREVDSVEDLRTYIKVRALCAVFMRKGYFQ